jgi:hypothetical protein
VREKASTKYIRSSTNKEKNKQMGDKTPRGEGSGKIHPKAQSKQNRLLFSLFSCCRCCFLKQVAN